jgi:serine carboxypeptidase-like clade II
LTYTFFLSPPFYSGDTDAVVPVTSTRYSIDALKLPTLVNCHPWYDRGKVGIENITVLNKFWSRHNNPTYIDYSSYLILQVGGWSQVYKGLTLVIITGAGHEVPLHRPRQALIMFRHFLQDKPMPTQ